MNPLYRCVVWLACLVGAAAAAAETRAPSAQERAGFAAFHAARHPGQAPAQPVFHIARADAGAPWQVAASIDGPAQRGWRTLCRRERTEFTFKRGWGAAERARQFVWLQQGACSAAAADHAAIELLQRMPDSEVLALLAGQAAALPKARLIMAGNSACAGLRSSPFTLAALDVGRAGSSAEELAGLVYRGPAAAQVTVWVRKSATGLDNWNVTCPPRPGAPT